MVHVVTESMAIRRPRVAREGLRTKLEATAAARRRGENEWDGAASVRIHMRMRREAGAKTDFEALESEPEMQVVVDCIVAAYYTLEQGRNPHWV